MAVELHCGDCLTLFDALANESIDMVCTDPPYGTTTIDWDTPLEFAVVWKHLERICKPTANLIFFGTQPFASKLILSNPDWFRYELIWNKNKCGSPGLAKKRPMRVHENILVFSPNPGGTYNPIMEIGEPYKRECKHEGGYGSGVNRHEYGFGNKKSMGHENPGVRYPKSIVSIGRNFSAQQQVHPTQKPTTLLAWLVETYSNAGDTVLDFTMGSGSTGMSAKQLGRNFIGFEKDGAYFQLARQRIDATGASLFSK